MINKMLGLKNAPAGGIPITVGVNNGGSSGVLSDNTIVVKANPANASGTLTTLDFHINSGNAFDLYVGTFEHVSGDTLICRSSENIGIFGGNGPKSVTISLPITAGHHIGMWSTTQLGVITSGGGDMWYASTNVCQVGLQTDFNDIAGYEPNIYATG